MAITAEAARSRGGRPSRDEAPLLTGRIVDAAIGRFLRDGYGATSIEAVAAAAGVSKRTLYARFSGKAALLEAAVAQLVQRWLPRFDAELAQASGLEGALLASARVMLATALMPEALALHRLVVSEIGRFPELAMVMRDAGAGIGTQRLAAILATGGIAEPAWAAEQFMALVLSVPQRRALGPGPAFDTAAQELWVVRAVALFLRGVGNISPGG